MNQTNKLPEILIAFRAFNEKDDLLGVVDVELPEFETISEEITGAGIAGKMEVPVIGHFGSMTLTMNWRAYTSYVTKLAKPLAHQLDLRGSIQHFDPGTGEHVTVPVQVMTRAIPKKTAIGKLATGALMDTSTEFEVVTIKVKLDGDEHIEYDKLNYVFKIDGTDYLESVKADLGLS